jgi:uncharacterized protein with HEPN domain
MCGENRALYQGWEEQFLNDEMVQDAVIRNFEIIGEAAKRVPTGYRRAHAEVPWRLMAGFRDVLIHAYEGVDLDRVWHIAQEDLPKVKEAIDKILPSLDELESNWRSQKTTRSRRNECQLGPTCASCLSERSDQQNGAFSSTLFSHQQIDLAIQNLEQRDELINRFAVVRLIQ